MTESEAALERLQRGNAKFQERTQADEPRSTEPESGEPSVTIVVGCADSPVGPETVFGIIMAILRPRNQEHFTLEDLSRGFGTVAKMLAGRRERLPVASVSFLGAKSNSLIGANDREPSFESVLRTMFEAGYRGDVYPSLAMWELAPTGAFASYPFPASLNVMRSGGF